MEDSSNIADEVAVLSPVREILAAAKISARKSLGQHFLFDINLTRRIARLAGDMSTGTTIEIGPGPGGLTRGLLLEGAREVVAIEIDSRAENFLKSLITAASGRLTLIKEDALKINFTAISRVPRRVVANLPYNIATSILLILLRNPQDFESLTLMFQSEVADRLIATPGSKIYGRLSVLVSWLCTTQKLMNVPPSAFVPQPKIYSSVVRLVPRARPLAAAKRTILEKITQAAFSQRRKMLRKSLKKLGGVTLIKEANLDYTLRPESLTVQDFCRLANAYSKLRHI
ncbi:dimethyladenosine transferase [Candidatus Endolissoclinum faulkneri L5]|uniref:Ribosomal RNA small subunit methyltransferase A n=1 Tax=Candidatus Endolissoclinum faulkneri L5 TaxID=1401328 RepID=V9TWQ4_9PROT|nr:16S rRNA (adenine(1518)-N(6)/adenine(1519)-N(6))-dimethyltransferase RsmA [Candidatus Endolissoclinum faulkneri]AHC73735.1 dimethyladenosine transferase [Candidatus Endolissoclinum faulkneri L5]